MGCKVAVRNSLAMRQAASIGLSDNRSMLKAKSTIQINLQLAVGTISAMAELPDRALRSK